MDQSGCGMLAPLTTDPFGAGHDMSGGRKRGALAATRNMNLCASRQRCLAEGSPLDGGVRRHDPDCGVGPLLHCTEQEHKHDA